MEISNSKNDKRDKETERTKNSSNRVWLSSQPYMVVTVTVYGCHRNRILLSSQPCMVVTVTMYGCHRNCIWLSSQPCMVAIERPIVITLCVDRRRKIHNICLLNKIQYGTLTLGWGRGELRKDPSHPLLTGH